MVLTLLALNACALVQDDVDALLARGQPEAALRQLTSEERFLPHLPPHERARIELRRGLAHLALSDRVAARWWLDDCRQLLQEDPLALSPDDRARLLDALRSLDDPLR